MHSGVFGTDDFRMRYSTDSPLFGVFGRPRRSVHRIELSLLLAGAGWWSEPVMVDVHILTLPLADVLDVELDGCLR